jgi:hypothetical protein
MDIRPFDAPFDQGVTEPGVYLGPFAPFRRSPGINPPGGYFSAERRERLQKFIYGFTPFLKQDLLTSGTSLPDFPFERRESKKG